ncbi:MAG: IS3 family transposase [Pyrinomonadaceae bacterium]
MQPVCEHSVQSTTYGMGLSAEQEPQGELLGQCGDGKVLRQLELKNELVHHERFRTRQEAKDELFDYIEVFYNRSRIHSATNYFAPAEYEVRYRAQLPEAA